MDLKKYLPTKPQDEKGDPYWALVIEPGWIQAGIWSISNGKAKMVSYGPPSAWELDEELVSASDSALSSAIGDFPEEAKDPSKTVFGVISSWVVGGQIKDEHLGKIKNICNALSLSPAGFVVLPEAIAFYMKSREGSPINAVMLGVYKEVIEVSIFRIGKLESTTEVARSVSVVEDVIEGLSRISGGQNIPSRFILYDGKEGELDDAKQALVKANWDDVGGVKFLHTPKTEVIAADEKVKSVSLAGASELADVKALESDERELDESGLAEREPEDTVGEEVDLSELGFSSDDEPVSKELRFKTNDNGDLSENRIDESIENVASVGPAEAKLGIRKRIKSTAVRDLISKLKNLTSPFSKMFKKVTGAVSTGKKPFVFGGMSLILLVIAGSVFWWYFPKASITIYIAPQSLNERVGLLVDPSVSSSSISEKILAGELVETIIEGESSASTTGTKTVGEKAQGEVVIYRVGPELVLDQGTSLSGPNGLKFTLDEDVVLASGSASSPGSTNAKILAEDIGAEYNLASGASFVIANYSVSDLEAKNESSFTGGSSREIQAVSQEDQEKLLERLELDLFEKAKSELSEGLSSDKHFIPESLSTTVSSKSYSNKVGDEASSLTLSLSIAASALVIDKDELIEFSKQILKDRVPERFVLRDEQIEVDFEFEGEDDGLYEFESKIVANLLPEIDVEEVREAIKGRYSSVVEEYLTKEISGFVSAEIKLKPSLPGRLGTLPRVSKNIEIYISAEK